VTPALVLVPGLGADAEAWRHQIDHLVDVAADIRVVDLRPAASRAEMAAAVLARAPARFALAGQSMGGWVAQDVAARAPERVAKLALLNTWARPDPAFNEVQRQVIAEIRAGRFEGVLAEHLPRVLHPDRLGEAPLVDALKAMQRRAGPGVFARHIQAMVDAYDSRDRLPLIRCPTLVIAGRQDAIFSVAEHEFIAGQIAGAQLAVIEDCGHGAPLERPQAVTALLRYWLTYL
jgi:pimeloyl-ACP methyl ester carboxylesterase